MGTTLGNAITLPIFYTVPCSAADRESRSKKMLTGDNAITEPNPKELTKHGCLDSSGVTPYLGTIKVRCPDPSIAQQLLP